ncbi:MAG: hypothetical protein M0Q91_14410 [Methanoregula sp.]|jgi:hypothetical protein|nr:hypothetical protein [Methanoregula sp.]
MKVLIACEESQVVCKAFRAIGHEAYSCDILPCSGGHPEWHIQDDVMNVLDLNNPLSTHEVPLGYPRSLPSGFDLMIAHPPCTYLANSGVTWLWKKEIDWVTLEEKTVPVLERWQDMRDAAIFFKKLLYAPIEHIAIENPIQHKYAREEIGVSWGQQIHPWQFGHMEQKPTCLWLKNVPPLKETNNVKEEMLKLPANKRQRIHYMPPSEHRSRDRAVTYEGIAKAMANQWG